jgi:hypothetical protein
MYWRIRRGINTHIMRFNSIKEKPIQSTNDFVCRINELSFPKMEEFTSISNEFYNRLRLQFRISYKNSTINKLGPLISLIESCDLSSFQIGPIEFYSQIEIISDRYLCFACIDDVNLVAIENTSNNVIVLSEASEEVVQSCALNQNSFLNAILAVKMVNLEILRNQVLFDDISFLNDRAYEISSIAGSTDFINFYRMLFAV